MKKKVKTGARSDQRALSSINAAGWVLIRRRQLPVITTAEHVDEGPRYVAVKRISESEDDTVTTLYESSFTLETLAKQVKRREEEEAR